MKVITRLAKMEFSIGTLARKGDNLILENGGDATAMKFKAQITPEDVLATIKAGLRLHVVLYVLQLPFLLRRRRREAQRLEQSRTQSPTRYKKIETPK